MLPIATTSEASREGQQRLMEKRETEPSQRLGLTKMGGDEGYPGPNMTRYYVAVSMRRLGTRPSPSTTSKNQKATKHRSA
jgi:hypothetical protein